MTAFLRCSLWAIITWALFAIGLGCSSQSTISTVRATPSSTPSITPVVLPVFELKIYTTYDTSAGATSTPAPVLQADCQIPSTTTPYGSAVACTNTTGSTTNSVAIPEGQLYYSSLTWTVTAGATTGTSGCTQIEFFPYYYLANNSNAAFTAPWQSTPINCTTVPTPAGCYGGLAGDIVPSFPTFNGVYFLTANGAAATWSSKSANSHKYGSNRYSVNNLTLPAVSFNFATGNLGDGYVSPNYQEYLFSCNDEFDETLYSFSLTITDIDQTGVYPNVSQGVSSINEFPDWDPTAWDR